MQLDSQVYEQRLPSNPGWSENCFRYCDFNGLEEDGPHIDSLFLGCTFNACDLYWALFNLAVFVDVKFKRCTFRGCSFADVRFVDCEFDECEFTVDSFGRGCSYDGARWFSCSNKNSKGLPENAL